MTAPTDTLAALFADCTHGAEGCECGCQCPCPTCRDEYAAAQDHAQHNYADAAHFAQRES